MLLPQLLLHLALRSIHGLPDYGIQSLAPAAAPHPLLLGRWLLHLPALLVPPAGPCWLGCLLWLRWALVGRVAGCLC